MRKDVLGLIMMILGAFMMVLSVIMMFYSLIIPEIDQPPFFIVIWIIVFSIGLQLWQESKVEIKEQKKKTIDKKQKQKTTKKDADSSSQNV